MFPYFCTSSRDSSEQSRAACRQSHWLPVSALYIMSFSALSLLQLLGISRPLASKRAILLKLLLRLQLCTVFLVCVLRPRVLNCGINRCVVREFSLRWVSSSCLTEKDAERNGHKPSRNSFHHLSCATLQKLSFTELVLILESYYEYWLMIWLSDHKISPSSAFCSFGIGRKSKIGVHVEKLIRNLT